MTYEEQYQWLNDKLTQDPYWADTESMIRHEAVRIQRELKIQTNGYVVVSVPRHSSNHSLGIEYLPVSFQLTRFGGIEELLLIEEQLRRVIYA